MVFFIREKNVKKLIKMTKGNVNCFVYEESHKNPLDRSIKVDYGYAGAAVPSRSMISSVVNGDRSANECVKNLKKLLKNPNPKNLDGNEINTVVYLTTTANMASSIHSGKVKPLVFVAEDPIGETAENTKRANKFVYKWLKTAFDFFGMTVLDDKGFKDFVKARKKFISKNRSGKRKNKKKEERLLTRQFITNCDTNDNLAHVEDGNSMAYVGALERLFHVERSYASYYQSVTAAPRFKAVNQNRHRRAVNTLFAIMCRADKAKYDSLAEDEIPVPDGSGKKGRKDAVKKIDKIYGISVKNSKQLTKMYKDYRIIMKTAREAAIAAAAKNGTQCDKIPKIPKVSFNKKGKGPSADVDKAAKFFQKRKNIYLFAGLIAHICAQRSGNEFGSSGYIKTVSEMLGYQDKAIAKAFETAVRAYMAEVKKAAAKNS